MAASSSNPAIELGSALQSVSLNRAPSPTHDLNPSTSASAKIPVELSHSHTHSSHTHSHTFDSDLDDDSGQEDIDEEDIPYSVLKPAPRRASFPPLPDMRFEQSYLASIAGAETKWRVAWITARDQVLLPLLQGTIWSLCLHGWRHWNRSTQLSGQSVGAKVRRWWYRTNNWKIIPDYKRGGNGNGRNGSGLARDISEVGFAAASSLRAGLGLGGFAGGYGLPSFTDVV